MHLIVGLGNPGAKYSMTRHNVGFMLIDVLAHNWQAPKFRQEHKSEVSKVQLMAEGQQISALLVKPQTFMNNSGQAVVSLCQYYEVDPTHELLVVHDDIDQPFGAVRFQSQRGHGGHNGIRDIHQLLGTNNYYRLKLGVDRPSHPKMDVADYVLQSFSKNEEKELPPFLAYAGEAVESYLIDGFQKAATQFNRAGF
ncbi:MAG: aminoacyl-tRNA hydrolase [Pseudobdellovibrionaceae bacterium]|nr:aminoacyl-tRNA hydrolase [Bdellovibrionales bacterium]USN46157.1 MAG: aminoacyl-tRNA hydrolase [Pseudobdellovibrionaceae bacterium]